MIFNFYKGPLKLFKSANKESSDVRTGASHNDDVISFWFFSIFFSFEGKKICRTHASWWDYYAFTILCNDLIFFCSSFRFFLSSFIYHIFLVCHCSVVCDRFVEMSFQEFESDAWTHYKKEISTSLKSILLRDFPTCPFSGKICWLSKRRPFFIKCCHVELPSFRGFGGGSRRLGLLTQTRK